MRCRSGIDRHRWRLLRALSRNGSTDIVAYNGSGKTPAAATLDWYRNKGITAIDRQTPHAVTVPGAVEAWCRLNKDHGRMPMAEVLAPAIELARDGYPITPRVSSDIANQLDLLKADPSARRIFLADDQTPPVGHTQCQRELAATMELIGREGPDAFYRGDVADDMVSYLQSVGGLHTKQDFAEAAGEYVTPIKTNFRGRTVYECPPNGQGIIALMILNILSRFKVKPDPLNVDNLHIEIEATRLAYAARDAFVADMAKSHVPVDYLLSDKLADELAAKIDLSKAIQPMPVFDAAEHKDTVYISVVDKDRNIVSFINSLFHPYGSGLMAPKSGVLFHNRGISFVVQEGHPECDRAAQAPHAHDHSGNGCRGRQGLHVVRRQWADTIRPWATLTSSSKVFDHGLDIQSAIDQPRLFPLPGTANVEAEKILRDAVGPELTRRGFHIQPPRWSIGGAQAIWSNT